MSRLSPRHLRALADCCCARRNPCYNMRLRESEGRTPGEVDERLKSHAWKACIGSNLSGVRIPLSPPKQKKEPPTGRLFLFGGEKQAACAACAGDSKGTAYRRALSESTDCFCRAAAEAPRAAGARCTSIQAFPKPATVTSRPRSAAAAVDPLMQTTLHSIATLS
jgi:hypothetical protein